MTPAQVEQLRTWREQIAQSQAALLALPDEKRRGPRGGLTAWSSAVSDAGKAVDLLDRAIAKATRANKPVRAMRPLSPLDEGIILAGVTRSSTQELRISAKTWKGERIVDVRLWLKNSSGFVPSRKGFAIEPEHLGEVIEALRMAQQHV